MDNKDIKPEKKRVTNSNLHKCLVFITGYMVLFLLMGLYFSIGTIFVDVMSTFHATRVQTAVIQSTAMAVGLGSGLLSAVIIQRFGIVLCGIVGACLASFGVMSCYLASSTTHMTISFGIVFALGFACLYICSSTAVGQHFSGSKKLIVLSLQSTGASMGGMMYPYLLKYLSEIYGFRGALLIIGGICMNCVPGCLLWKQPTTYRKQGVDNIDRIRKYQQTLHINVKANDDEITIKKNNDLPNSKESDIFYVDKFPVLYNDSKTRRVSIHQGNFTTMSPIENTEMPQTFLQSVKSVVKNTRFMIFALGCFTANPTFGVVVIFVADVFNDKGLTLNDVTFGLLLMNIVNIVGRLIPGAMLQSKKIPTLFCPLFASLMATVILVGFSLPTSRNISILVCALTGIPFGMFNTMFSVITAKLVGAKNLPTAIGLLFSAIGVGNAYAGPFSGYIRDISGSYAVPFYCCAGMTTLAMLLFLIAWATQKVKKNHRMRRASVFYVTSM